MLDQKQMDSITDLLNNDGNIAAVYLFGSQKDETASQTSDVDLAILLKPGVRKRADSIALALEAELSNALNKPVDVRPLNPDYPVSPIFQIQAMQGEILVGRDNPQRVRAEVTAHKLFEDAQAYLQISNHYIIN